jgi:hypothetical protein
VVVVVVVAAFEADDTESIGLTMDHAFDGAAWDNMNSCLDFRQLFRDMVESDPTYPEEHREAFFCVIDELTDEELRSLWVDGLLADDPAATDAALERAVLECVGPYGRDILPVVVTS